MSAHDALGSFNTFHLWHGNVHEHHVRIDAVIFGDGRAAIAGLTGNFTAEGFHHLGDILACKHRIVHHQITDRCAVLAKQYRKMVHTFLLTTHPRLKSGASAFNSTVRAARCGLHWMLSVLASISSGTTRDAYPLSIAALGMP